MPQKPIPPGGALCGVGTGRLDECRKVLESVLEHEDTVGIPILVLANKRDREGCVEVVRIKEGFVRRGQGGMVRDRRALPVRGEAAGGVGEE
jgi:ADP-ribosylation factor related protein 1